MDDLNFLVVDDKGTKLTYTDSGTPPHSTTYTTLFTLNGMGVNAGIYARLSALAPSADLRLVAINRRSYGGSTAPPPPAPTTPPPHKTPLPPPRGLELAAFLDRFIQTFAPPPVSADGRTGGLALVPWSAGNGPMLAAVASVEELAPDVQARFAAHV
ncbi:hypothetical protein OF83DRAFT_1182515, partial [Amylostereum chailletii]